MNVIEILLKIRQKIKPITNEIIDSYKEIVQNNVRNTIDISRIMGLN